MASPKKILKKGELLFNEGDKSDAMYFVNNGTIRLFKKKGTSSIEIGMIHKGEVIGEMGFLDGGARSASAEAMYDTELSEINAPSMADQLKSLPQWLSVLLKTVVNRLRSANNKIRQLEAASTSLNYKSESGSSSSYQFLPSHDILKICISVMSATSRGSEKITLSDGTQAIKTSLIRILKFANQILSVHQSKVTEFLDVLERINIAKIDRTNSEKVDVYITDFDQLEVLTNFISDENQKEASKQTNFTLRGVVVMGFIVKYLNAFPPGPDGVSTINLALIIAKERESLGGKDPFRIDEINELIKNKVATEVAMKDATTVTTKVFYKDFQKMFKIQKALKEIDLLNEKKREKALKAR